jgi:hypothetical protein
MQTEPLPRTKIALSDAEYEGWPLTFTVCRQHKEEFFRSYPFAVVSEEPDQYCIMGHWIQPSSGKPN